MIIATALLVMFISMSNDSKKYLTRRNETLYVLNKLNNGDYNEKLFGTRTEANNETREEKQNRNDSISTESNNIGDDGNMKNEVDEAEYEIVSETPENK